MKLKELEENELVLKHESGKYICSVCNKQYTKKGIATHYHYSHTEEGKESKKNISNKLEGKTKKELVINREIKERQKKHQETLLVPKKKLLTRDEIKVFLSKKYKNNDLSNIGRWIKNKYINIYNSIVKNTNYLKEDCTFSERIFHILHDLTIPLTCKKCDNLVTFKSLYFGYYEYCGSSCVQKDKDIIKKKKQTCLAKYGVSHQSQTKEFKEKTIQTNLKNFGVEYPAQSKEVAEKTKQIFLDKYGVNNPMKLDEFKNKPQDSFKEHCVKDPNFVNEVQNKKTETFNTNYGADHFMKTDFGKNIVSKTILTKYGVSNYFQSDCFKDKQKQIFLENFNIILNSLNIKFMDSKFENAYYDHKWLCLKCNSEYITKWNYIQQGYLCPTCYPRNNGESLLEKEVVEFIKEILNAEQIIENDRTILSPKELDIYIPFKNIAIEFNGLYWHSEERLVDKQYHLNKTVGCEKQGIQLIHIFEDEWMFKKNIVKARLAQILGVSNNKHIHARKCTIKEISPSIKNKFLEKFHIQGEDGSVIKLGAFYNNELVSVMTFSHGNISRGSKPKADVWELNRFCSHSDYHIPGIASKLLTHFKRNFEWKEIFSYADRRWSKGNVYYKLGFELEKETGINYWYIKDFQRIHRFNLRKQPDEPKDISEWILRRNNGYLRIWDCGSLKFQLINNKI